MYKIDLTVFVNRKNDIADEYREALYDYATTYNEWVDKCGCSGGAHEQLLAYREVMKKAFALFEIPEFTKFWDERQNLEFCKFLNEFIVNIRR
jgi:hypothetical protein